MTHILVIVTSKNNETQFVVVWEGGIVPHLLCCLLYVVIDFALLHESTEVNKKEKPQIFDFFLLYWLAALAVYFH